MPPLPISSSISKPGGDGGLRSRRAVRSEPVGDAVLSAKVLSGVLSADIGELKQAMNSELLAGQQCSARLAVRESEESPVRGPR
jgi:hypothetical protein